jgi:transcriptional regulator
VHANRKFWWDDKSEILEFIQHTAFAHLFVQGPDGPLVAHVPVVVTREGNLRFHLAKSNPVTRAIEGAVALASFGGEDAYISPDWYGSDDQVPTWNYVTAEVRGPVTRLSDTELAAQLDDLSAEHEARLLPKRPWTRAKMSPGLFEGMLKAIVGFEMTADSVAGTLKLGQNKQVEDRMAAIVGLRAAGAMAVADLMAGTL